MSDRWARKMIVDAAMTVPALVKVRRSVRALLARGEPATAILHHVRRRADGHPEVLGMIEAIIAHEADTTEATQ